MSLKPNQVERVERAAAAAVELHDLVQRLALSEDERSCALGKLTMAFEYAESFPGEASGGVGTFFKPMMEFEGRRYPPGLDQLSDEVVSIWQEAAEEIAAPLPRARLNDLCFEGGWGNRGASARAAATAYLEAAATLGSYSGDAQDLPVVAFGQLGSLARALGLARTISDGELIERAYAAIVGAAEHSLTRTDPAPGVALGLIELLLTDRGGSLDAFDSLIERAKALLADDLFNRSEAIKLQLRRPRLDEETRAALQRELVTTHLRQADAREGIARVHFLQEAAQLAADFGIADLREGAIAELQKIGIDDLGLTAHRFEVTIPREHVERYLDSFTEQENWENALLHLLAYGPPSGFTPANREQAEEIARRAPLLSVVPHMEVGGDGLPRFIASTEEEKRELRLVRYEMQRAQFTAAFLPEALERIWQKWGPDQRRGASGISRLERPRRTRARSSARSRLHQVLQWRLRGRLLLHESARRSARARHRPCHPAARLSPSAAGSAWAVPRVRSAASALARQRPR